MDEKPKDDIKKSEKKPGFFQKIWAWDKNKKFYQNARFWTIVVIIILISAIGGGGSSRNKTAPTTTNNSSSASTTEQTVDAKKDRLTLDDGWTIDRSNEFVTYINGYVSNNSNDPIENYVQISFKTYDEAGNNLNTCLANANYIDANGKWKFQAVCGTKDFATAKFDKISGF